MKSTKLNFKCVLMMMALFSLANIGHAAEIIKIVDANGRVSYSDHAPIPLAAGATKSQIKSYGEVPIKSAGENTEKRETAALAPTLLQESASAVSKNEAVTKSNDEVMKANSKIRKANEDAAAKVKQENCETLKKNIATLNAGKVGTLNIKGERSFLTDEEIVTEKKKAEASLSSECQ